MNTIPNGILYYITYFKVTDKGTQQCRSFYVSGDYLISSHIQHFRSDFFGGGNVLGLIKWSSFYKLLTVVKAEINLMAGLLKKK